MGGIYIPNMDLPKNCFQCPAHEWFDFGGENHGYQCPILHTTKAVSNCEARTKRRDNCPMIEIKKHGRLKDYDYVMKQYSEWFRNCESREYEAMFYMLQNALNAAPTIIQASK